MARGIMERQRVNRPWHSGVGRLAALVMALVAFALRAHGQEFTSDAPQARPGRQFLYPEWQPEPGPDRAFERARQPALQFRDAAAPTAEEATDEAPDSLEGGTEYLLAEPASTEPPVVPTRPTRRPRGIRAWPRNSGADLGIGAERVEFALFEIDSTQPMSNFRFRFDAAYNMQNPDRAEFYWAKIGGRGPGRLERRVDYQDIRMYLETGGETMSAFTEVPIRIMSPFDNDNTAGLGDVIVGTKIRLLNQGRWQMTQILRTYINSGVASRGLGTGHVSMEPGMLFRYRHSACTYLHSEIKLWFPIAGDTVFSGPVLRSALGWSHVLYDNDDLAIMPTLELITWSVLDGAETSFPGGREVWLDHKGIINLQPGLRVLLSDRGPGGKFELGVSGAFALTRAHWYQDLLRFDLRWSF